MKLISIFAMKDYCLKSSLFILILIIICSCKRNDHEVLQLIDKEMITHFPEDCKMVSKNYLMPSYNENLNSGFYYKIMCREDNLDILKDNIVSNTIQITKYNDSCSFVLDRSKNKYMSYENCISCTNCFPIPRFIEEGDYFNLNEQYPLPNDFDIYILEAKKGIFLDDHLLIKDIINVPNKWKHGMTRGIAISEERNMAIYYIDIW